eukprot:2873355-Rhodomonas_salina.3
MDGTECGYGVLYCLPYCAFTAYGCVVLSVWTGAVGGGEGRLLPPQTPGRNRQNHHERVLQHTTRLRARYALPGTDVTVHDARCLRACYAMSGTDLRPPASRHLRGTSRRLHVGRDSSGQVNSAIRLRACYPMSGTD